MNEYKNRFIDFLLSEGALSVNGAFKLKNGRISPYFFNAGALATGKALDELGRAYAETILTFGNEFDIVFGPSYKGVPLAVSSAFALWGKGLNVGYSFDRKEAKNRGEASADRQKEWIVGSDIRSDSRIVLVDDVITTGSAKYDALELIGKVAPGAHIIGLVVAVDRQEVGDSNISALEEFIKKSGIKTRAIVNSSEIYERCAQRGLNTQSMKSYLLTYGSEEAKHKILTGSIDFTNG